MRWFLADVLGLFSANVGPFSRNVVPGAWIFSINVVSKPRMFSIPAIYVLDPLQVPVRVAPPVAVVAPPGVAYARPAYPLPGPGYAWAYHPRYGWGWRHPVAIRPTAGIAAGAKAGWAARIAAETGDSGLLSIPAQSFWRVIFA